MLRTSVGTNMKLFFINLCNLCNLWEIIKYIFYPQITQITQIREKNDRIIAGVSRAEMQQEEFGI
jgi:hypothetical protein